MPGAYVRIKRNDEWLSLEVDELTDAEMETFFRQIEPDSGINWAIFLAQWIRDNVVQ